MKNLIFISLFLALFSISCNNDREEPEESVPAYYVSIFGAEKQLVRSGETITLFAGETLTVYIDPYEDPSIFTGNSLYFQDIGVAYKCSIPDAGEYFAVFQFGEGTKAIYFYFYIQVLPQVKEPSEIIYYITESTTAVDVPDPSLQEAIRLEVENRYIPRYFHLKLNYASPGSGTAEIYYKTTEETIPGFFIENESGLHVIYSSEEHHFQIVSAENGLFEMIQDLTTVFQAKYPEEAIDGVVVRTLVIRNISYN